MTATLRCLYPLLSVTCSLLLSLSPAPAASLTASRADADTYRVQSGDALLIGLWGDEDFGGPCTVGARGTIALPIIGSLRVAGMTVTEVREAIARALREHMHDPYVTVALDELNSKRRVYVTGCVEKIGSQMLPLGATAVEALAAAGLTEDSDLSAVRMTRTGGEALTLNLSGMRTGDALQTDPVVQWDDRLYVPRLEAYVTIVGRVQKPGSYLLPPGRPMRLLDLLTQVSGGVSEGADYRVALLNREGRAEPQRLDLARLMNQGDMSQNPELKAGDVLVIPEALRAHRRGACARCPGQGRRHHAPRGPTCGPGDPRGRRGRRGGPGGPVASR